MSTDSPAPRTRAEARALRDAAEAAAHAAVERGAAERAAAGGAAPTHVEQVDADAEAPVGSEAVTSGSEAAPPGPVSRPSAPETSPEGEEEDSPSPSSGEASEASDDGTGSETSPSRRGNAETVGASESFGAVGAPPEEAPEGDPRPRDARGPQAESGVRKASPAGSGVRTGEQTRRRFGIPLVAVLGILALVGGVLAGISLFQGPRLSGVQVDAVQAIEVSGSRVILTSNEALSEIDPAQVTVTPDVPFTVDAAGRSIGVRFTVPLDDATEYTVKVAGVTGTGGGPVADLQTAFTTPASEVFLLTRDAERDDKIFRTDLSGEHPTLVYAHERIDDFRATSTQLVVAVEDDEVSQVLVMNRDGSDERELELPGDGFVTGVQVSDRGGLVGYSYSDKELSDTSGRASVLVTQRLDGTGEPRIVEVAGEEASVAEWHFVPDSAAVLFIDFAGALALEDLSGDAGIQALGTAMTIQGVSRGTYTAIIERTDGSVVELNLADGSETPLAASDPDYGTATTITPYPGGTLRHVVARDENGFPTGQAVVRVTDDGEATPLVEVPSTDSILQTCASPSGQYAAVVVAPDLTDNPYDDLLAPLPQTLHTHLIDLETGDELVALTGFDISWCPYGPVY
ncbi:TolB-like translocation protein [Microbacterium tumbae]